MRRELSKRGLQPEDFININVCGHQYNVLRLTLEKFPMTLLGNKTKRQHYYVDFLDAYYFDQSREIFESILYYYQSGGSLVRPYNIPMDLYIQAVHFFGLSEDALKSMQIREGYVQPAGNEDEDEIPSNYWQREVWLLMEFPESSVFARIMGLFSILIIFLSITTFCVETLPQHHHLYLQTGQGNCTNNTTGHNISPKCYRNGSTSDYILFREEVLSTAENICAAWFTIEYIIRFLASPNKWNFFKSTLNLIDLCAVLPYYVGFALESKHGSSFGLIRVARLVRVFRVFKLSRYSLGLQVLGHTLKASINELAMILFMVCFSVIIFSSAMFYAEQHDVYEGSFKSIPDAFWYTLVTITTVGYGDYFPLSPFGKLVGGICAISGVLVLSMVVPVIANNFDFFYKRDRMNQARKEEKRLKIVESSLALKQPKNCETSLIQD